MRKSIPANGCLITGVLFLSTSALGMPAVSGNTLTWPADGWYQVQNSDTLVTVCEGNNSTQASTTGGPCIVDPGRYIVINHTTGERFEKITTDETPDTIDSIVVNNERISWPDDGWYQVQNAESYATVCEGGLGCNVSPGEYIVINHSTGEHYDGITVSDEDYGDSSDDTAPQSSTVVFDSNFPSMNAVAYTRIATSLPNQEQLMFPIEALTQNIISVLD